MKNLSEFIVEQQLNEKLNSKALLQRVRAGFFAAFGFAQEFKGEFVKKLKKLQQEKYPDYVLTMKDKSDVAHDKNNLYYHSQYWTDFRDTDEDCICFCLHKKGSDKYVVLNWCLWDNKKDDNGKRDYYLVTKFYKDEAEEVLDEAVKSYESNDAPQEFEDWVKSGVMESKI